jgi:coproporphyrinogen III oxidase-like Fe-S oxidoreductase
MTTSRIIPIFAAKTASTAAPLEFRVSPPLALYVHIPWCVQKCPYCDFNSHEADGAIPETEYVAALIADLQSALPLIWGRPVTSVFFGGGTPSLLSPAAIDELIAAFRALAMLSPEAEITLEANPGTVEAAKFTGFAMPASTACRSASRVSMTNICKRSAASTAPRKRSAPPNWPVSISSRSIWI